MKITVLQEHLAKGLGLVSKAVANKTTLPVLNNILLETENGRLKLGATNLEMGITTWIDCQVEEEGATTIPAKLLNDFISSLPNERIDMIGDERSHNLSMKCDRFEANIKGLDAAEFPVIPQVGNQPVVATIKASVLHGALTQLVFVAATDDTRPVLTGVQIELDSGKLKMVAADGFRLATLNVEADCKVIERTSIIVPGRALAELGRILPGGDEVVDIIVTANKSQVIFHTERVDLVSRLIDGPYPNISQIIPVKYDTRMVVDTAIFLKAMKIASYFARASSSIVKMKIEPGSGDGLTPGRVTISANAAEVGDNVSRLETIIEGAGGQIAFNAEYIIDVLSIIDTPQVALEVQAHTNPGVFKPIGSSDYTHVIMPMHLPK